MRQILLRFAGPCIAALAISLPANGQTVINVPPDEAPTAIGSDTQLNLFEAGSLANGFNAGSPNGLSTNVEVNVSGGVIGRGFDAFSGSIVNMSGGIVRHSFGAHSGSTVNLSGGSVRGFEAFEGTMLNIFGGEFRLDGVPIVALEVPGSTLALNPPEGTLLSGTLADGTPLAAFFFIHGGADRIEGEVLTLRATSLPPIGPAVIDIPNDAVPLGIRQGQTLNLGDGGSLRDQFIAARGSVIDITGGTVGPFFAREGTTVKITGGTVEDFFTAVTGATVDVFGGVLKGSFRVGVGGTVNLFGGTVERMKDTIGIDVTDGGTVNISGGSLDGAINARSGSTLNIVGTEFLLDGLPIAGLDDVGDSVILSERGGVLQATLRDGEQFDFPVSIDRFHTDATLRLILAEPVPEPSTLGLALLATLGLSIRQPRRRRRTG